MVVAAMGERDVLWSLNRIVAVLKPKNSRQKTRKCVVFGRGRSNAKKRRKERNGNVDIGSSIARHHNRTMGYGIGIGTFIQPIVYLYIT
jgi:hypothetical protein